jgi:hypothetical protein
MDFLLQRVDLLIAIAASWRRFSTVLEQADVPSGATVAFIKLDAAAVKNKFAQLARTWRAAMVNFVLNSALVIARKLNKAMLSDIEKCRKLIF